MLGGPALVAAAVALAVLHGCTVDAAVWRVPVQRHLVPARDTAPYLHADSLAPWGARDHESKTKRSSVWTPTFPEDPVQGTEEVDFVGDGRSIYSAKFMFGTPPQSVSLALTLGGTDVMVINHEVGNHKFYDHAKSSTYRVNGTRISLYEHTAYAVQGFVSSDDITIPESRAGDGLQVHDLSFVELESPDSFLKLWPPGIDGSIGLGARVQNATGAPSIMRSMITQGLLDEPVVGFQIDDENAHVKFGGIDAQYKDGDITYFTDTREERLGWWVPLTGIRVNGEPVVGSSGRTILLEGLTVIGGPRDRVEELARVAGAENYSIPCDGPGPDITISLGQFEVTLKKTDYAIPYGDACLFAFFPAPFDYWMLGRPVLKHVYMVLDYGKAESDVRLGLAHLKAK